MLVSTVSSFSPGQNITDALWSSVWTRLLQTEQTTAGLQWYQAQIRPFLFLLLYFVSFVTSCTMKDLLLVSSDAAAVEAS